MMIAKRVVSLLTAAVMVSGMFTANAEDTTVSVEKMLEDMPAQCIVVTECTTGKRLYEKNPEQKAAVSHLAKLMTLLITAELLETGDLDMNEAVTVSASANAKEGAQIWLDKGEKIKVEELIKAITVGNANDACTALAEHIAGSEEDFTALMNDTAKRLGMNDTFFADCCGMSDATVSTAADMAVLAAQLVEYEQLRPYFTCWLDTVRGGKAELVSQNRLVRTYKGITGLKACGSSASGECAVVTAQKNDMKVAVVILGCDTSDNRENIARMLLDKSFECFSVYTPDIDEKMLEDIPVTGGETDRVSVGFEQLRPVVIPKGSSSSFEIDYEKEELLTAPVKVGQTVGSVKCTYGSETIFECELTAKQKVAKMNFKCGMKKLMYNLLEMC